MSNFKKAQNLAPDLPWTNEDPEKLGNVVMSFVRQQEVYYRRWAQRWFENMQFIYGNSAVRWSRRYDFAVDVDLLRPGVSMEQRASTNISRTVFEALTSLVYSNEPTWEAEACEEGHLRGQRFQKISEKLLNCFMERLCGEEIFQEAASIYTGFGQVGFKVDWNNAAGDLVQIPQWRKVKAPVWTDSLMANPTTGGIMEVPMGAINSQGQPYFEDRWEAVVDASGRQTIKTALTGTPYVRVLTPLEYRKELGKNLHNSKFVEEIRVIDYDDWLREYSVVEGKTKYFDDVIPEMQAGAVYNFAIRHFMRMQYTTPPSYGDGVNQLGGSDAPSVLKAKVLVVEHYDKPDAEMWPRGRRVITANGFCTHITEPSYFVQRSDGWHPFAEALWLKVPPSGISSGPMDSVTAKNRELNTADSLISTALRRNLGSIMLYQHGSGFDPQKATGAPGQMQGVANIDGVRWLHDSQPISPVVNELRNGYKEDIYETSGAGDAIRGDRSKGVSSGYALKQVEDREQRRLSPARKNLERAIGVVGGKLIAAIKANVIKLDEGTMGYMKRAGAGEFTSSDVVAFLSSPVTMGTDIRVRPGSMLLKSSATIQANLMELAQGPAQSRLQDPDVLDKFLEYFGAEKLRDVSAIHRDRANRENDTFSDMMRLGPDTEGVKTPIVLVEDDDDIHMSKHSEFILKNHEELSQNEWLFQSVLLHQEMHRLQGQEKAGKLIPGTKLLAPGMMAQARQNKPPQPQQVTQAVQASMMQQAQTQPTQQPPEAGAGGPGQVPMNKPASQTPGGKMAEKKLAQGAPQ